MTEEELYAGAGEITRKCLDDILESEYGFVQDDEETYTSEYLLTYPCKTFAEGLTDTLLQHGFSGQADDAKEKIAYVRECCKQRGVTLNPEVIKSWFCGTRPNSGERSRDSLFRLCFALGLNDRETASFFQKVYFSCPFNFRSAKETVIWYCLRNGLGYPEMLSLAEQAEQLINGESTAKEEMRYEQTSQLENALLQVGSTEELLCFFRENRQDFQMPRKTAIHYAKCLIQEATELAQNAVADQNEISHQKQKSGNVDLLLSVIFGENMRTYQKKSSFSKEAVFPELIRSDFPLGMNLSRIKRGESVSDTILRKTLILLNFYCFFATLFAKNDTSDLFCAIESDFLDFVHETNDLLCSSGLPALYVRNPYDWLFLHCANHPYPLEELRSAMRRYYFDQADEKSTSLSTL